MIEEVEVVFVARVIGRHRERQSDRRYRRRLGDALFESPPEALETVLLREPRRRQAYVRYDRAGRVEAGIHALQPQKAVEQQRRAEEQRQRERELRDHEAALQYARASR